MADNVPITSGSGTSIATDDVSGVHYQKMKLFDGTADSSTPVAADATFGLAVDVKRAPKAVDAIDTVNIGGTEYTVKRANFAATASGDTTVIAAVTSKVLRVLSVFSVSNGATDVTWKDGAGTTLLANANHAAGVPHVLSPPRGYVFATASGQLLKVNLSASVNVSGIVTYVEI